MDLTVQELAVLVGGQFVSNGDPATKITGAAAIAEAGAGDITFFGNARYLPALKSCKATAVLVPQDFAETIAPLLIRVDNPTAAFSKVLERFAPKPIQFAPGVHPTAVIAEGVELGEGVSIQPRVVIEAGAKIGARTFIGAGSYVGHEVEIGVDCHVAPHVTVGARCLVGNRVTLHTGVVLGGDGFGYEFIGGRHVKIPQTGIVQLDDDVDVGANTTIDRARFGRTWIGEGTKIDNLVQIAHNVVVGKHSIVCAQVGVAGSTRIGNYVVIGGQAGIIGHIEIEDGAQIGAQSGVSRSVPPKEKLWGTPSQPLRDLLAELARVRRLPKLEERIRSLEQILGETRKSLPAET